MKIHKYRVGEIRPSQVLLTYGVGAIIDLPLLAAMIMGLDDWDTVNAESIVEERLLAVVKRALPQVNQLLTPPAAKESMTNRAFTPGSLVGVPVAAFPRWMVCPRCKLLASVDDGFFKLKNNPFQPEKTCYIHEICPKAQGQGRGMAIVLPSRFMIACDAGHLDDFPFRHFLHGDRQCKGSLRMKEFGASGEPSDILIECDLCESRKSMSQAFSSNEDHSYHPTCRGRRPHLRDFDPKQCKNQARTTLLSASNTWFPLVFSTLALPSGMTDQLGQLIEEHWGYWKDAEEISDVRFLRRSAKYKGFYSEYSDEEILQKIEQYKIITTADVEEFTQPGRLKVPEWQILINPQTAPRTDDFEVSTADIPEGYEDQIQQVVLVERLREVRALTGFTRLESLSDYTEEDKLPAEHIMPLARRAPTWVPASEVRGEGIFIQFREEAMQAWLMRSQVKQHAEGFHNAHCNWRKARNIDDISANDPGMRYILLHTFAHALMRQLTLECGYTAASIRERIYAQSSEHEDGPMAGILLYTAASDSEGTLGGLVDQGKRLGFHIYGALEDMKNCASDPLCAEHEMEDGSLHAAACHACMFAPETSCERGNRYLDRSVLVSTVERDDLAFFQ